MPRSRFRPAFVIHALCLLFGTCNAWSATPDVPNVAPDIDVRLAKFRPVDMPFERSTLSERQRKLVDKLVDACQLLDTIYWHQSDIEGWELFNALKDSTRARDVDLRRL